MNTITDWKHHIEVAMGYRNEETLVGDVPWIRRIYEGLCRGEAIFGATTANAMEALLEVVAENDPDKYGLAIQGLKSTVDMYRENGNPVIKLGRMIERVKASCRGKTLLGAIV